MTRIAAIFRARGVFAASAVVLGLLATSCDRQSEITVYRIPKETPADGQTPAPADATMPMAPATVRWTAPAGWQEQPATGFRKGSFSVPGPAGQKADVSVVSFPGDAGGLLENINRWRDQLHLAPMAEDDLKDSVISISVGGFPMQLVDIVSAQPMPGGNSKSRVLGGILSLPGETWFFKMTGPDELVEAQGDTFGHFLQSLQIDAASGAKAAPFAGTNPPATAPIDAPRAAPLKYEVPKGWKEKPLTPMRVASFSVPGGDAGDADASIVVLSGTAGGELSNINRWRGQIGLPPMSEGDLNGLTKHVVANGHDFLLVDLVSPKPPQDEKSKPHMLVAMLSENDQSWFVKMIGPDRAVTAQRDAFIGLLKTMRISP